MGTVSRLVITYPPPHAQTSFTNAKAAEVISTTGTTNTQKNPTQLEMSLGRAGNWLNITYLQASTQWQTR